MGPHSAKRVGAGTEVLVGAVDDFAGDACLLVSVGSREIGVRRIGGTFYAFENRCLHQGGPACEGRVVGRVEERLELDGTVSDRGFSNTELHLVCPWHGWEYDVRTGEFVGDRRRRLRGYETVARDGQVYLIV